MVLMRLDKRPCCIVLSMYMRVPLWTAPDMELPFAEVRKANDSLKSEGFKGSLMFLNEFLKKSEEKARDKSNVIRLYGLISQARTFMGVVTVPLMPFVGDEISCDDDFVQKNILCIPNIDENLDGDEDGEINKSSLSWQKQGLFPIYLKSKAEELLDDMQSDFWRLAEQVRRRRKTMWEKNPTRYVFGWRFTEAEGDDLPEGAEALFQADAERVLGGAPSRFFSPLNRQDTGK